MKFPGHVRMAIVYDGEKGEREKYLRKISFTFVKIFEVDFTLKCQKNVLVTEAKIDRVCL